MIEREYVKLNTSIQTGSNASTLKYDDEGNIEASIELRLPDSLFTNDPAHKIDSVQMQTSKMRLSMENTPIAAFPLDEELTTENTQVTKCQVDVYPYSFLDDNKIAPTPGDSGNPIAFPNYKKHFITYKFKVVYYNVTATNPTILDYETIYGESNNPDLWFPKNSKFYQMLQKTNVLSVPQHMMNITTASNHEDYRIDGDIVYVRNIGGLTQMLQDALENAVTYASTEENIVLNIYLLNVSYWSPPDLKPIPQYDNYVILDEFFGDKYCFWKMEYDAANSIQKCDLAAAFKPQVRFDEQSMSISYDTASFKDMIPIFWNPCFVNTFSQPEQMTIDTIRNEVWGQPPPKRIYRNGVDVNVDPRTYSFTLPENMKCALMNFIGNEQMRKIFSFLPWIKMDLGEIVVEGESLPLYSVEDKLRFKEYTASTTRYYNPVTDNYTFTMFYVIPTLDSNGNYVFRYKKDENGKMYDCEWMFTNCDNAGTGSYSIDIDNIPSSISEKEEVLDTYTTNYPYLDEGVFDVNVFPPEIISYNRLIKPNIDATIAQPIGNFVYASSTNAVQYSEMIEIDTTVTLNPTVVTYIGTRSGNVLNFMLHHIPVKEGTIPETFDGEYYIRTYKKHPNYYPFRVTTVNYPNLSLIESRTLSSTYPTYYDQHRVTVTKLSDEASDKSVITPNLTTENNSFYILDGTTSEVTIGQQEPLEIDVPDIYRVTTGNKTTNLKSKSNGTIKNPRNSDTVSGVTKLPHWRLNTLWDLVNQEGGLTYEFDCLSDSQNPSSSYARVNETWVIGNVTFARTYVDAAETEAPTEAFVPNDSGAFIVNPPVSYTTESSSTTSEPPFLPPGTQYEDTTTGDVVVDHITCTSRYAYDPISRGEWKLRQTDVTTHEVTISTFTSIAKKRVTLRSSASNVEMFVPIDGTTAMYPQYYDVSLTPDSHNRYHHHIVWDFGGSYTTHETGTSYPEAYKDLAYVNYYATEDLSRTDTTAYTTVETVKQVVGNQRLTFTWNNLPIVVLSPISSIVLTLDGMQVTQEYQPVNIAQPGASSLTSSIPVIENFYSLAATLRDLHDELVVSKDSFDDTATYTMSNTSGYQRSIRISAKYITKDGTLHQIYIPPNGVFCIQLTFGLGIYTLD